MDFVKIQRRLTGIYVLLFILAFLVIVSFFYRPAPQYTTITKAGSSGIQGRIGDPGLNGKDGKDGVAVAGVQGIQGLPGQTTIQQLQPLIIAGEKGDTGSQGEQGTPGLTPEVRVENCQFQTKYPDNDEWVNRGEACNVTK